MNYVGKIIRVKPTYQPPEYYVIYLQVATHLESLWLGRSLKMGKSWRGFVIRDGHVANLPRYERAVIL